MLKNVFIVENYLLILFLLFLLFSCDDKDRDFAFSTIDDKSSEAKIDILYIDKLFNQAKNIEGPKLYNDDMKNISSILGSTPSGAYIASFNPKSEYTDKIKEATARVLQYIAKNPSCKKRCSDFFNNDIRYNNGKQLLATLQEVTRLSINNELANMENYQPFYHGFGNEFRLYQDVLRIVKSFEYLKKLEHTYPLRDFAFNDNNINLSTFLAKWWGEYIGFVKQEGKDTQGSVIGLSYFPDSITFARNYLLSANVNLLGNTLSPTNSTIFFYLNSTGASQLNIIDNLLKNLIDKYVINNSGTNDEEKLDRIIKQMKDTFSLYMADSGGQLAQIFIKKDIIPEVSFLSWNGGEPMWFKQSNNDKYPQLIFKVGLHNKAFPPHIFSLDDKQKNEGYYLPNIAQVMKKFIFNPQQFDQYFPIFSRKKLAWAKEITDDDNQEKNYQFLSRDMMQARILPNPKYFTDENFTGVRIFTQNEVSSSSINRYNDELYQIIRSMFADFLANAKSQDNFKNGNYKLKELFINK